MVLTTVITTFLGLTLFIVPSVVRHEVDSRKYGSAVYWAMAWLMALVFSTVQILETVLT